MMHEKNQPTSEGRAGDPLDSLLREARWPEPSPESLRRLEEHFRGLHPPRSARLWWPAAAAAVLALAVGTRIWLTRAGPQQPSKPKEAVAKDPDAQAGRLRAEIAQLDAEAESHIAAVRVMLAMERTEQYEKELRRYRMKVTAAERIAREVEQTAFAIVYNADRMRKQDNELASAVAAYRDVIRLFPYTPSADVARKRLKNLENREGDSS